MANLSDFSPEVIQNYLFPYLSATERGKLEQANKRFCDLSRNYLSENLKRDFGTERKNSRKFYSTNPQEAICLLYICLYRCSKILSDSEMQALIQAINEKNDGSIEETLIICQEIKITALKKKIRGDVVLFFEKIEQLLIPWIPDCLLCLGEILLITSPFFAVVYSIISILAVTGLAPAFPIVGIGSFALFFVTLSLILLLYISSGLIVEKLKLVSEYSELKQLKISLEANPANVPEILQEKSFTCGEETTSSVRERGILTKISSAFLRHTDVPPHTNDLHEVFSEQRDQEFQAA